MVGHGGGGRTCVPSGGEDVVAEALERDRHLVRVRVRVEVRLRLRLRLRLTLRLRLRLRVRVRVRVGEIGTGIDALHAPELVASLGTSPAVLTCVG